MGPGQCRHLVIPIVEVGFQSSQKPPGKLTVIMRDKPRRSRVAPLGQGGIDRAVTLPAAVGEDPQQPARLLRPMPRCCRSPRSRQIQALDRTRPGLLAVP